VGSFASRSLGIILIPLYTQYLTVVEYGALSLLNMIFQLTSYLCVLGIGTASMRAYYDKDATDESRRLLYGNALTLLVLLPALIVLLLIPVIKLLVENTVSELAFYPYVLVVLAIGLFHGPIKLVGGLLRVQDRAVAYVSFHTGLLIFQAGLIVIALAGLQMGLLGQVYSQLLANMIFGLMAIGLLWRYCAPRFDRAIATRLLIFGLPLVPFFFFAWSNRAMGSFFLGSMGDLAQVGLFAIASQFSGLLTQVATALDNAIMPEFLKRAGEGASPDELGGLFCKYLALLGMVGLVLVVFAHPAIHILTTEVYYSAYELVPLLMTAAWLFTINQALAWNFIHSESTATLSSTRGLTALSLLLLILLLVGYMQLGVFGVIYAMILANSINIGVSYALGGDNIVMRVDRVKMAGISVLLVCALLAVTWLTALNQLAVVYLSQCVVVLLTYILMQPLAGLPTLSKVILRK